MTPGIVALALIGLLTFAACRAPTPSTPAPTPTVTAVRVMETTVASEPNPTPSPTYTPEPTATPTPLPLPTSTPRPSPTPAPLYVEGWRTIPGGSSLDRAKPDLASMIVELPWVADGIGSAERQAVQQLVSAAMLDEPVFLAVVGRPWVVDGLSRTERNILQELTRFTNQAVASLIPGMPFLETVEPADIRTVDHMSSLDGLHPMLLTMIADLSWVGDGIAGMEIQAIRQIRNFADGNVALSVIGLGWVQDGIEQGEPDAIEQLAHLDADDPAVAASVVGLSWAQDGIEGLELEAVGWINNFGGGEAAASVVGLPWVQDGIEGAEVATIEELSYVAYDDSALSATVAGLKWMQDWVDETEFEALEWIGNFRNPESASSLVALQWARDGIEEIEVRALEELSYIDYDSRELASAVVGLGWIQDGITDSELEAIGWIGNFSDAAVALSVVGSDWVQDRQDVDDTRAIQELSHLSNKDSAQALRIVTMPFLESLEPPDISAIDALSNLAWFRQADFQRIISHPTISEGITDDWAKIVATLYGVSRYNSALIDVLLDPEQVTIEERTTDLPLAGETYLAIIRTGPGAERSMDLLDHSVRQIEDVMGIPFPNRYVGWLVGEAVTPTFGGNNFGTHIATLPKYDVDDGSNAAEFAGYLVAHEVAHYYWSGNSNWVDEGAADFMASVSENSRTGRPVEVTNNPCGYVSSIKELEDLDVSSDYGADSAFACNYALGERLFVDLYRTLGNDSFWSGFTDLYLLSQVVESDEGAADTGLGIEDVKAAFKDDGDPDSPLVDTIAARWYDGSEPYATPAESTGLSNPILRTINGRIHTAYLSATEEGAPLTSISTQAVEDYLWLLLRWDYNVQTDVEVPLELVQYYEDGFVFDRREESFTANSRYNGDLWKWWLRVGQSPDNPWAVGRYGIRVYNEGQKLVELEYEVTE